MTFDDELSAAAKTLHREWESPDLWPAIAAAIAAEKSAAPPPSFVRSWRALAAAAVVVLAVAGSIVALRDRLFETSRVEQPPTARERFLTEQALSEVERAEAQYIAAVEALARKVAPAADATQSPLVANLRERLLVIDAAIADCRAEIEHNRFNAHLRRHLLVIYQEKRRTLEQILEHQQHVS